MIGGDDNQMLRLLAVEDDPNDQAWLLALLEDSTLCPYHISFAPTMADAEVSLTVGEVDCVLLDLSLPDSWGFESVERITRVAPHVPIVVVTGQDDTDLGIRAIEFGAHDYLNKGKLTGDGVLQSAKWAAARAASRGQGSGALSRITAPLVQVGRDAKIVSASPAFIEMLGLDPDEVPGTALAGLVDEGFRADFMRVCSTVLNGTSPAMALPARMLKASGGSVPRIVTATMLGQGELGELVLFFAEPKPG